MEGGASATSQVVPARTCVRILLRDTHGEENPRFYFTCARCFTCKTRVCHLRKWTARCVSAAALQGERQKRLKSRGQRQVKLYWMFDPRSRRRLCDAWQMSREERCQFIASARLLSKRVPEKPRVRDVTVDGDIEPNPGPSLPGSATSTAAFHQWYLNVGACE